MLRLLTLWAALFLCSGLARAQDQAPAVERLRFRVVSFETAGVVEIDRGTRDGVEAGDLLRFLPREGGVFRGRVLEARERTSLVELEDLTYQPEPGTPGVIGIPRSRFEEQEEPPPAQAPTEPEERGEEDARWENEDEGWTPDQPLLAGVRAVRPRNRSRRWQGRLYLTGHSTTWTENGRSDLLLRTGMDMRMQNPFGAGGILRFDGEVQTRDLTLPDDQGEDGSRTRIDRMSYRYGGTRFAPSSWEAGRFLQQGVPEFGVLDGAQWTRRLASGDRFGVSAGYLPVPDDRYETGEDLQLSAFYTWVADQRELFTWTAGLQKTWHNGNPDRDLFLTRFHLVTERGWDLHGTAWLDYYSSGDDGSGVELTQALVYATRRIDEGDGIDVRFRRTSFPEVDREEFEPLNLGPGQTGVYDRFSGSWWTTNDKGRRFETEFGVWRDDRDEGGDAEALWEHPFGDQRFLRLAAFGTVGSFSNQIGGRLGYRGLTEDGFWDLSYELANHRLLGFSADRDDLLQHRLHGARSVRYGRNWLLAVTADGVLYDEDGALSVGITLQRNFR